MFRLVGGRAATEQRVASGAAADGHFEVIVHTGYSLTTNQQEFAEPFSLPVRCLYAADNFLIRQEVFNLDTVTNSYRRALGESVGTFALEAAIDELAYQLHLDPLELRLRNEPTKDPIKNIGFSLRTLAEAYRRGAEKFNWQPQPPRSQREDEWLIGQGVATATYPAQRIPAATHEIGMGTATFQIQHAAQPTARRHHHGHWRGPDRGSHVRRAHRPHRECHAGRVPRARAGRCAPHRDILQ